MTPPEPSILAADYDIDYDAAATFFTDLSLGSLFTKALLLLLFVFLLIRLSLTILRRRRAGEGDNFPTTTPDNDDTDNDEEENPVLDEADIEAAIKLYPSFMYNNNDKKADGDDNGDQNNTECPICMCEYREFEMMRRMPQCGHYFHLNCLDHWLRIKWSCPVCRDSPSMPPVTPAPSS